MIHMPSEIVTEGGRAAADAPGLEVVSTSTAATVISVGSGDYEFAAPVGAPV
jgi:hypothetical protein